MKADTAFIAGQKFIITGDTSIGRGSFSIVVTRNDSESIYGELIDSDGHATGDVIEAKKEALLSAEPFQPVSEEPVTLQAQSAKELADEYAALDVPDVAPVVAAEYMKWPTLNKVGRVFASNAKLYPIASTNAAPVTLLKERELVFVERVSGNGWLHITTAGGNSGYLADVGFHQNQTKTVFVNTLSPDDPAADIYQVKSGDTALSVAQKHYGSFVRPGHDARYFIGVLAWANGRGSDNSKGIFHVEGKDVKAWETNWFAASGWESCTVVADRWIWVPTANFARQLESEITDGSLTNGLWSQVEDVAEAVAGGTAFIAGVVAGAVQSIWDLVTGLVELGKILVKTIKSLVTGHIVSDVSELLGMLSELDIGDLILRGFGKLAENWNQDGLLDRWYFRGKVIGYILAEILLLVFTGGAAAAKWAGRFGKLGATLSKSTTVTRFATSAQKLVDAGGDAIRYARGALRGDKSTMRELPRLPRSLGAAAYITTRSVIKESSYAKRLAQGLGQAAQRDVDKLVAALRAGNMNPGIGTRALGNGFFELRGANAGRVIVKQKGTGTFDIVGKFQGHVRGDAANSRTIQRLMNDYTNL
ncbi:MAG: hypothetical protein MJE77_25760 [Proteobacteria bacterium]|nr:hypothetical protein [Pseudomonadota bacterium]